MWVYVASEGREEGGPLKIMSSKSSVISLGGMPSNATRPPEFMSSKKEEEAFKPAAGSPNPRGASSPADRRAGAAASMVARVSSTRTGGGGEQ